MLISICIPVFNGEKYLQRCLDSLSAQTFKDFEIIVIDDCSTGTDEEGRNCKKICKVFAKQNKIKVNYQKNHQNLGSLEARRTAVYEAKGEYIFCVDCDDVLRKDCLEILAEKVQLTKADIIQCGAKVEGVHNENSETELTPLEQNRIGACEQRACMIYEGTLENQEVFNHAIVNKDINFYIWGKLIKRDVFVEAWDRIPVSYCVWGEDFVICFFVFYYAKKYVGITDKLYVYSVDTGISSKKQIDKLEDFEKKCTAASVFGMIFGAISNNEIEVTDEQKNAVQLQCNTYARDGLVYLANNVADEIKVRAYEMFCEYWGKEYVQKIEEAMGK